MAKNYLTLSLCLLLCFTLPLKSLSQVCSTCSGTGDQTYWCVTTAQQLYDALFGGFGITPIASGGTVEICGTINLGELSADLFPLELPATNITLRGNYDFVTGTRILFPYRYRGGITCDTQQRIEPG
ncbi:MAG TPA: hypothetical protein PKL45_15450, partial [Bacteroidia bacterium]|nr:hypothetical protein [Bacteroidia bacterium]